MGILHIISCYISTTVVTICIKSSLLETSWSWRWTSLFVIFQGEHMFSTSIHPPMEQYSQPSRTYREAIVLITKELVNSRVRMDSSIYTKRNMTGEGWWNFVSLFVQKFKIDLVLYNLFHVFFFLFFFFLGGGSIWTHSALKFLNL